MANLIAKDNMTTLVSAADARTIAKSALLIQEEATIAYAINSAVNTGLTEVLYNNIISDAMIAELQSLGYTVNLIKDNAKPGTQYKIVW